MSKSALVPSLAAAVFVASVVAGCHSPGGSLLGYTGSSQTLYSTETSPKTMRLYDVATEEVIFEVEIPAGKQLTYRFEEKGGDDPVLRPAVFRYELFNLGTKTGKLTTSMSVPASTARRVEWFVRDGFEPRPEPPEYRMRVDELAERPDWFTNEGGPMSDERTRTNLYDN